MAQLRLQLAAAIMAVAAVAGGCSASARFEFQEATVDAIQLGFKTGTLTSKQLVLFYLDRIERLDPDLHAFIEVNPDALAQAARADAERPEAAAGRCTASRYSSRTTSRHDRLNTTAGSMALLGSVVRRDAGVATRLRAAGAEMLGKTNPTEWSAFRDINVPSGWSARGGQTLNPYVHSATPCGSSSGSAVANLAAVTLGTETDGSIICPSSLNSVVGIKPTVGLTSRAGVIPIIPRQALNSDFI